MQLTARRRAGSLALLACASWPAATLAGEPSYLILEKWTEPRVFHEPFDDSFAWRIELGPAGPTAGEAAAAAARVLSPNRAYWYALAGPDFRGPGPWTTDIFIYNERDRLLRLRLRDHGNTLPRIKWINEKLLYAEIWWGRIAGSSLILDVEAERVVLREMARDGGPLYRQYLESAPDAE